MKVVEKRLGFKLPNLLRKLYLEVSNGGFGPGYGLLSFGNGAKNEQGQDIVEIYEEFRKDNPTDPLWKWPEKFLPVCKLGCGMYICVDCSTEEGATIWFEPNPRCYDEPLSDYLIPKTSSTEQWLAAWLDKPVEEFITKEDRPYNREEGFVTEDDIPF